MRLSGLDVLCVAFGVVCLGVAALLFFISLDNRRGDSPSNIVAAGACCGFAIAGGLSFVAGAIAQRPESRQS